MVRWYHVLAGGIGLASGGGAYLLAGHVGLAVMVGLVWGTAVAVIGHGNAKYPDQGRPVGSLKRGWVYSRWIILCVILVYGSAQVVGTALELSFGLPFVLALLVFGVGAVGFATGYLCALDEREAQRPTEAPPEA